MRLSYVGFISLFLASAAVAQTVGQVKENCRLSVAKAEVHDDAGVYDRCGFNNEQTAWNTWAGWVSQKQYKKALYQLCVRWPHHPYSDLYCEKSANLGYGPAIAEQGHRLMAKGLSDTAMGYYARALKTRTLSDEQEGQVATQIGLYYLNGENKAYSPAKAVAFFESASKKRSALANNALGYLTFTGELGVQENEQRAFEYLWRGILLGCPAAEENLGLFHLARLKKITKEMAAAHMKKTAFTCQPTDIKAMQAKPANCDCDKALRDAQRFDSKPYYLISVTAQTAQLQDNGGSVQTVAVGQKLPTGHVVAEVRKTAVILEKAGDRVILNLYTEKPCADYCKEAEKSGLLNGEDIQIKPYRLSFSPNECQDLMYYAPSLVDTSLPYVGKYECAGGITADDDPLLKLLTPEKTETPNTSETNPVQIETPGVTGQIGAPEPEKANNGAVQKTGSARQKSGGVQNTGTRSTQPIKKSKITTTPIHRQPSKKEIHFTVGGGTADPSGKKDDKKQK